MLSKAKHLYRECTRIGANDMNYKAIVQIYIAQIRPRADDELNWFRQQSTLREAIRVAAPAINSKGKRYSHQRRLSKPVLETALTLLLENKTKIGQCKSFDELHTLLDRLLTPIKGIGELYVYDTALRIGSRLGVLPQKIYLHAGTCEGARALGFDGKIKALTVAQLPKELQQLEPHEIEDVLCIFKDKLVKTQKMPEEAISRSWCH